MQRIELVELIEGEIAKLSPECKEAWEEIEQRTQFGPLDYDLAEIIHIFEETGEPPESGLSIIVGESPEMYQRTRLTLGLPLADTEEHLMRSERAHEVRKLCVVKAAQARDHFEGRQIDRDMIQQEALARLKDGS